MQVVKNYFLQDWRVCCFFLAIVIYALWGSPTPDRPGLIELSIGFLLLVSVAPSALRQLINLSHFLEQSRWQISVWLLWMAGLTVPLCIAALRGVDSVLMMRDVAGFVFLCLPLFFFWFFKEHEKRQKILLMGCFVIGLIFSARTLFSSLPIFLQTDELLYLANSPLVLFTTLFFYGYGGFRIYSGVTLKNLLIALLCFTGAALCVFAMYSDVLRASFLSIAVSTVVLFVIGFVKAPRRMIMPSLLLVVLLFLFQGFWLAILEDIILKTSRVGLNMRWQEWLAVWDALDDRWTALLLGAGWGSAFASPAVGGLHVTFTHSLLSYMLLKAGLVGLILCLIYLFFVFEKLARVYFSRPVVGNALLWPFAIPVLLYASHKSFDYGLLLVLVLVMAHNTQLLKTDKTKLTA